MRRVLPLLLAAAALAGCGDTSDGLLSDKQAQSLLDQVDSAEEAITDERCVDAREAAQAGERRARALPRRVDRELRSNLVDWFRHLEQRVDDECEREEEEPEETPTPSPTPEETETPTPTPEETETPTPTPTPTPEETPTPVPTPDTGGNPGPGGGAGPGPDGEDLA